MMKKVLLIGYPFPLRQGGSPRVLGLAKYLPEFGWQPIILTAPLNEEPGHRYQQYKIVETDYKDPLSFLKKMLRLKTDEDVREHLKQRFKVNAKTSLLDTILTFAGEFVNYPDSEKGWKPHAIRTGAEVIKEEGINAIISSSAPVITHIIARQLKNRYKIPWIADLRDLWTQNHNYSYSTLRKKIDRKLELRTFSNVDALTTVSQPWADKLSCLHNDKVTYFITNGFDPETENIPPVKLTDKFTLTYTGTIYPKNQDPLKPLTALQDLITNGKINPEDVEVRFYGHMQKWLEKEITQYGLSNCVKQYGFVPQHIANKKQRESQLLLLLDWDDPQEKGTYTGKIYEYFGARRPILATGGTDDNVVAELLNLTKAGIHASTVTDIKKAINMLYCDYKKTGNLAYCGNDSEINKYSHREMAREFADILDLLTK